MTDTNDDLEAETIIGAARRVTYDANPELPAPAPGTVLLTVTGKAWLITAARLMESKHPNRWALECHRVTGPGRGRNKSPTLPLRWYARGKK